MRKPGRPPYVSRREEAKEGKDYRDVFQTVSYKYGCVCACVFRPLLQDNRALSVNKASAGQCFDILLYFRKFVGVCSSSRLFTLYQMNFMTFQTNTFSVFVLGFFSAKQWTSVGSSVVLDTIDFHYFVFHRRTITHTSLKRHEGEPHFFSNKSLSL